MASLMQLPLTKDTRGHGEPELVTAPAELDAELVAEQGEIRYRTHRRFDRAARLFSEPGLHRLMDAHVAVIGVGGVGSFAAEALARSGVGRITLVDFDRICITNTNRQLHAMKGTIGKSKVEIMAERLRLIHPTSTVNPVARFYDAESGLDLIDGPVDYVVDAIDNLTAKAHLIANCRQTGLELVSCMGAAARLDPQAIRIADLSDTVKDPMARAVRKILRQVHGIDARAGQPTGVDAVFSIEEPLEPSVPSYDEGVGFRCVCPGGKNGLHDCDRRARIDGTASFVTGSFGLAAAGLVVRRLISGAR